MPEGTKPVSEWLQALKPKQKFYIWTAREKQTIQDACLSLGDIHIYLMDETQQISYNKALDHLECKYRL